MAKNKTAETSEQEKPFISLGLSFKEAETLIRALEYYPHTDQNGKYRQAILDSITQSMVMNAKEFKNLFGKLPTEAWVSNHIQYMATAYIKAQGFIFQVSNYPYMVTNPENTQFKLLGTKSQIPQTHTRTQIEGINE